MAKQFSSWRRFTSFRVVNTDGETAFQDGSPVREIPTDALGAIRAVWVGDFTPLQTPGRYRVITNEGVTKSSLRRRAASVRPRRTCRTARLLLPAAFTKIDARHARGPWVHASDAALAPSGVVNGWHDAGDFSLYSASTNSALFWLLSAVADFSPQDDNTGIPESGNGVPDLLDVARWGLEWLLSVQDGPYGTNWPEHMSPYRAGEVGTIATGRAVGTPAFASVLYRPYDSAFAGQLLARPTMSPPIRG